MTDYLAKSAIVSDDGLHRYRLWRRWGRKHGKTACFVMLNPSTADGEQDDPTIRRCVGFAKREGCDGLVVVNQFAYRATSPLELWKQPQLVARGRRNHEYLFHAIDQADIVIAAWGDGMRGRNVWWPDDAVGWSLGPLTRAGQPRHPLYLKADTPLLRYVPREP